MKLFWKLTSLRRCFPVKFPKFSEQLFKRKAVDSCFCISPFISNVLFQMFLTSILHSDKKLQGHLSALVWKNKNLVIWNK